MRTLALILTMHRSGSSATMRTLESLGMSLGPFELLGATDENRYGHFESLPLLDLDREVMHTVYGYADEEHFDSPVLMERFRRSGGTWSPQAIQPDWIARGKALLTAMVESGDIVGFKDPRVPLVWPLWRQLLEEIVGVRVLPLFLLRTPHEIAMSLFSRRKGDTSYIDALDACAIHYQRLEAICSEFSGEKLTVRYDDRYFHEDLRSACEAIGLTWSEDAVRSAFDEGERHHSPASVPHEAQASFDRLVQSDGKLNFDENLRIVQADSLAREAMLRQRLMTPSMSSALAARSAAPFKPFGRVAIEREDRTQTVPPDELDVEVEVRSASTSVADTRAPNVAFTTHNIRLADGSLTKPDVGWTFDQNPWFASARRILETAFPGGESDVRVADLGCLEGGFTVEFARLGYRAVGIDAVESHIAACNYVKERTELPNLSFVKDDPWKVGKHGPFDAIFCWGLFYDSDRPIEFLRTLANATQKVLILQTHFATDEPVAAFPGLSDLCEHEGVQGRWFSELRGHSTESRRQSFWVRREHLLQAVCDAGFDTVLEQFDGIGWPAHDIVGQMTQGYYRTNTRGTFVGIKSGI